MKDQQQLFSKQEKLFLNRGQLLIESLLAILVFLIAFVGFYTLVYNYLINLKSANNRIIANFLALEGIELVRAYRNYYYAINSCRNSVEILGGNLEYPYCEEYTSSTWLGGWGNGVTTTKLCLDYNLATSSCDEPQTLYLNSQGFFSINPSGTSTKFKRLITIESNSYIENATSVIVTSKIEWDNNNLEIKGIIYNISKIER